MRLHLLLAVAAFLVVAFSGHAARACGGLVNKDPTTREVVQTAERVLLARNGNEITAVAHPGYTGAGGDFAWLIPVRGDVDVGLSSSVVLDHLQHSSNLQSTLRYRIDGQCAAWFVPVAASQSGEQDVERSPDVFGGGTLVSEGRAGPYDWVVLDGAAGVDSARDAVAWLADEGYRVPALAAEMLPQYFAQGMDLLVVRLESGADSGDIRPIRITYHGDQPMIPLRLTASSAVEDTPILVWVLGPSRAVPTNYLAIELNDAYIDWFNPAPTYADLVARAVDEVGGQAFVTQYAAPLPRPHPDAHTLEDEWEDVASTHREHTVPDLLDRLRIFGYHDGMGQVIERAFPTASDAARAEIRRCGSCVFEDDPSNEEDVSDFEIPDDFDWRAFLDDVYETVVRPVTETRALLQSNRYITRMFTVMSPADMRTDPTFDFNFDLGDVDNGFDVYKWTECGDKEYTKSNASWRMKVPSGLVVRGESGEGWPYDPNDETEDMPANLRVLDMSVIGHGHVVRDNFDVIDAQLDDDAEGIQPSKAACACDTSSTASVAPAAVLSGLLLVIVSVRRRS